MKKILVCDDSLFMRDRLKQYLADRYEIVEDDLDEAVRRFQAERPEIVLIDIMLPEGEKKGLEIVKTIRQLSPETAVFMVTGVGENRFVRQCQDWGVRVHIVKPFDDEQAVAVVRSLFSDETE